MSNEVSTIDFSKQRVAAKFAALNPEQDNLAEGLSSSYGVIGIKGKTWTLKKGGDKKFFIRPDDGTPAPYIDVVILRQAHGKSRAYYEDYQDAQSEGKRPICASLHGVVPDVDVEEQQSETCGLCPRNKRILNPETGKQSTECRENKRLALLLLPAQTAHMFDGKPLMEPVFLRVPAASLSNLAKFGDHMASQGCHYSTFITRISFDPTKAYQSMVFRAVQMLEDAEADTVLALREDPLAKRITGEDEEEPVQQAPKQAVIPPPAAIPGPVVNPPQRVTAVQPAPAPTQAPGPAPAQAPFNPATGEGTPVDPAGLVAARAVASPSTLQLAPEPPPPAGAFAVPPAANGQLAGAPGTFTVAAVTTTTAPPADTGPATAATAELEAQIAALMPNKAG